MTKLTPMDLDALREAYANNPRNLFAEQVVWCLDELKGAREQLGQQAAAPTLEAVALAIESALPYSAKTGWQDVTPERREMVTAAARAVLALSPQQAAAPGVEQMREALRRIAGQELSADMSVDDQLDGDFEGAYNTIIEEARAALAVAPPPTQARLKHLDWIRDHVRQADEALADTMTDLPAAIKTARHKLKVASTALLCLRVGDEMDSEPVQNELRKWVAPPPIPMVLFCPRCHAQHVDAANPENGWDNPPHKSHLCHSCAWVWRPADIETTGVQAVATKGKIDGPVPDDVYWSWPVVAPPPVCWKMSDAPRRLREMAAQARLGYATISPNYLDDVAAEIDALSTPPVRPKNDGAPTRTDQAASEGELLPCPFCGGTSLEIRPNNIGDFYVICYSNDPGDIACGASTSDRRCETEAHAIARWNQRAVSKQSTCSRDLCEATPNLHEGER